MSEIWILGESKEGVIDKRTLELIEGAKILSKQLNIDSSLLFLGDDVSALAEDASAYGVNKIYKIEHPLLKNFTPDLWVSTLEWFCKERKPKIFLMSHSFIGREIGPRLAFRLNTILTTDCIDIKIDPQDGLLLRTKPIYGGNAISIYKCRGEPQMVTIRKNSFSPAEKTDSKCEIIDIKPEIDESMIKVVSLKKVKEEVVELDKANVVIAGGAGIAQKEDFNMLQELAKVMSKDFGNVMIGCSRPVVDKGWMSSDHQVGLTGAIISPDIYIAVGISGAIQHLVGMIRSKKIITINIDPESNIFNFSDYGVVEDYRDIIPILIKKMEEK